jgi:pimeloyl-ACP methyl ester carboxylesterase
MTEQASSSPRAPAHKPIRTRGMHAARATLGAAFAIVAAITIAANALAAGPRCGPFGDPPARVQHGWFARFISNHNPICFGGMVAGPWQDAGGIDRYACVYEPGWATKENFMPLVVFLHGSVASADSVVLTGLKGLVEEADLGGRKPGFILLAPEGRYTAHYYPRPDSRGLGWDNWYRQLNPAGDVTLSGTVYRENADAAAIDHFVREEIATGKVDLKRIYVMGWSNGAAMALLYALNRPWVAAGAVYSAPNPFGAFDDPCPQTPVAHPAAGDREVQVFNPRVPLMHVRNACDIGGICPNATAFAGEMSRLKANLEDVIIDSSGEPVKSCDDSCGTDPMADGGIGLGGRIRGFFHHVVWPRGFNGRMLDFLRRHPLPDSPAVRRGALR